MAIVAAVPESVRATAEPWQLAMKTAIRSAAELCRRLELDASYVPAPTAAEQIFPVFAPLSFVERMELGNPFDPLLRQVLPLGEELKAAPDFTADPVGDSHAQIAPGLLQKYHGRVLLITTGSCAVNCRYCFRRLYPYGDTLPVTQRVESAIRHISGDPSVEEVILSGGDPLTIPDSRLSDLVQQLAAIPHVRRLRVHSRLPIVIPERVTEGLIGWLRGTRLTPIFVIHSNHPRELNEPVAGALGRLVDAGVPILNQAVLLRGVNDDAETLIELSRRLVDLRVFPYYLHQLDRVTGATHFEVPVQRGLQLIEELQAALPGYAVPKFVQEISGDSSKRWLR